MSLLQSQQQSRQQAIERALKNQEEESDILKNRSVSDLQVAQQRKQTALEQGQKEAATTQAGQKYTQKVKETALKSGIALSPYIGG